MQKVLEEEDFKNIRLVVLSLLLDLTLSYRMQDVTSQEVGVFLEDLLGV